MKSYIVDSFTSEAFKGNPAAVCLLDNSIDSGVMLKIAQEFNLSETAFIKKTTISNTYSIQYFSPKIEIPLCGHATLASAKVLFETTDIKEINFITTNNVHLFVKKDNDEILMEFPLYGTVAATAPDLMLKALGLKHIVDVAFNEELKIFIIEINDDNVLAALDPSYDELLRSYNNINGVVVSALSKNSKFDFHYRYFWPWSGTNEDPVTGGVQTFLAKYWSDKLGKYKMKAFQSSKRSGYMDVEIVSDKVIIKSKAVIILEGNLAGF